MSKKETDLLLTAISKGLFPSRVFKYRDLGDRTFEILKNAALWFATAESFNDPFDCNLSETNSHELADLEAYLDYQKVDGVERASIINIFHTNPEKIRDICINARNGAVNSRGILSLSCAHDNILMWSHYAREHTGIVLAFDMVEDPDFFLTPYTVKYEDTYTELNYFRNRKETITANISTKAKLWDYEKEIRVIKPESRLWNFNRSCLKEIYFGCKTTEDNIEKVKIECANNGLSHVKFFKAETAHGKFSLNFIQLP